MVDMKRAKNDITYELFDINPAEFYAQRFVSPLVVSPEISLASRMDVGFRKIQRLLDAMKRICGDRPVRVLEVGCGSGLTGAHVKFTLPNCRLYGVDMSQGCIEACRKNQFDEVVVADVFEGLPYPDESFDFVYTMDFFGHIEFGRKDAIIAECCRVTKKGGHGWHGIEAGSAMDYCTCNPTDPEDPVRKYVWTEGHVGLESVEEMVERFAKWFTVTMATPWPIKPFMNVTHVLPDKLYGEAFNEAFLRFDSYNSRICADVTSGYCSEYILDRLFEVFGPILTREAFGRLPEPLARFAERFIQGSGFALLAVQKRS